MKSKSTRRFPSALIVVVAIAVSSPLSHAQSTWTGTTGAEWGTAGNWTGGVPNAIGAVANINTALTVNVSDTGTGGSYPYTFGTLATSLASGSVVIGNNGVTTDILTAETSLGVPVINVANSSASIFFYANLQGTQGFEKTGAGKLTFRFNSAAQTYSGPITITGGILGITNNGSLGNADNDITIANGARLLLEPSPNATVTLGSTRTITLTGTQSQIGASNAADHLIIDGAVTESVAGSGLVKTDAGKVTLNGTVSYTGETRIAGGTLGLSGSAALPTGQNLRFTGNAVAGTLDVGSTSQTVRTIVMDQTNATRTVTGAGGSLTVSGDADLSLGANNGITYSFAGLDAFTFNRSNRSFLAPAVNVDTVTTLTDINLAKGGVGGGSNTITANLVRIGGGNSLGNNGNTVRLHLGTTNEIRTNSLEIGGFNAGGVVDFQAGLTAPTLKLRGTDGTSALTTWKIGETSSGSRRGEGVVNLTGGSLDALVTNLTIGRHLAGANLADTSFLTMPAGSLTAATILLGEKTGTGAPVITASLNQGGGTVKVSTLTFGKDAGGGATPDFRSSYNLAGGTLNAATIEAGSGAFATTSVRRIGWTGGTIANLDASTDLTINGVSGTGGSIILATSTATAKNFTVDANRKITLGANTSLTGSADLAKNGNGTLLINGVSSTYTGTLTVSAGTLGGETSFGGNLGIGANGTLAPGNSPGTMAVAGNLGLAGTYVYQFTGGASLADLVNVGGTLDITGGSVTWENLGTYTINDKFTLFGYISGNLTGTFAGYSDDTSYVFGGGEWLINYNDTTTGLNGGSGTSFVTITAIPEPGVALLGGLGIITLLRRRRLNTPIH